MEELGTFCIVLAALLMAGPIIDFFGRHSPLPRVTRRIVFGVLIGPSGLDTPHAATDG